MGKKFQLIGVYNSIARTITLTSLLDFYLVREWCECARMWACVHGLIMWLWVSRRSPYVCGAGWLCTFRSADGDLMHARTGRLSVSRWRQSKRITLNLVVFFYFSRFLFRSKNVFRPGTRTKTTATTMTIFSKIVQIILNNWWAIVSRYFSIVASSQMFWLQKCVCLYFDCGLEIVSFILSVDLPFHSSLEVFVEESGDQFNSWNVNLLLEVVFVPNKYTLIGDGRYNRIFSAPWRNINWRDHNAHSMVLTYCISRRWWSSGKLGKNLLTPSMIQVLLRRNLDDVTLPSVLFATQKL